MKGRVGICLALCLVLGNAGIAAEPELWDTRAALTASVSGPTQQWRDRLANAATVSAEAVRADLDALLAATDLSLPARERVLFDFATSLRLVSPDAASRAAVEWLTGYENRVLVPHEEGGTQFPVPLYPVASAARGTDNAWRYAAARREMLTQIDNKSMQSIDFNKLSDPASRQGSVAAFREAPTAALTALKADLLEGVRKRTLPISITAAAAERLGDVQLYAAVLSTSGESAALRLLTGLVDRFDADTAYALLDTAAGNPALTSAALVQMGRLYDAKPAVLDRLFGLLGDPVLGGSAATALARTGDAAVVSRMDELLAGSPDRLTQARAVLALRLDGSEDAVAALRRFGGREDTDPQLRKEVKQWLAQ